MRKQFKKVLKDCFADSVLRKRDELGLTQSQMAERLAMESRSYIDLEHGKSCCGTLTLLLYVFYVCEDGTLLDELRRGFDMERQKLQTEQKG